MRKEIEKSLESIFSALTAKSNQEAASLIEEAIKYIKESKIDLSDPDKFNIFFNHNLNRTVKLLASTLHEPSVCENRDKPSFIYSNYDFLERHIRELCTLREGSRCCADKSRYILKMFLKYSINGEIPDFDPNLEKYYIPKFGDNKMWLEYCDSLYRLYYGKTEEYFKAYNSLLQAEIRRYKHFYHTWFITLSDGSSIEFGYTWDDDLESPLTSHYDRGDYYIINKRFAKGKDFEAYIPAGDEEDFLFSRNYVKLPKLSIKNIYYKTEEKMV